MAEQENTTPTTPKVVTKAKPVMSMTTGELVDFLNKKFPEGKESGKPFDHITITQWIVRRQYPRVSPKYGGWFIVKRYIDTPSDKPKRRRKGDENRVIKERQAIILDLYDENPYIEKKPVLKPEFRKP